MGRPMPAKVRRNVTIQYVLRRGMFGMFSRVVERQVRWVVRCNASHGRGRSRKWEQGFDSHNAAHMAKARHNREFHGAVAS